MHRMNPQTDEMLIEAVLAGDRSRFAELVRRYEPVVRAAVVAILRDTHLAQDVLQEVFLRVYTKLGTLVDRSRFGPWVLKIARRMAYRARRRRQQVESALELTDSYTAAERNGRLDDDSHELLAAVGRLPAHEHVVVVLHYFESQKVETIAQMTGRPTGTVTKQLSRARRRLEKWLREKV